MKFKKLRKTLEDMGFIFNDYTYTTPNYFTSRYCIEFLQIYSPEIQTARIIITSLTEFVNRLEIKKRKITYIRKDFVEPFSKLGIKVGKQVEI